MDLVLAVLITWTLCSIGVILYDYKGWKPVAVIVGLPALNILAIFHFFADVQFRQVCRRCMVTFFFLLSRRVNPFLTVRGAMEVLNRDDFIELIDRIYKSESTKRWLLEDYDDRFCEDAEKTVY